MKNASANNDTSAGKSQGDALQDDVISRRAKLFRGLGDPSRLAILDALTNNERSVQDIVALTGLGQPNVSNHLRCLLRWSAAAPKADLPDIV